MRDGLAAETTEEKDAIVLNVTEHNTENKRLFSHHCIFFNSVPSKPRCINPMQTWLLGYTSVMLASFPDSFLCPDKGY